MMVDVLLREYIITNSMFISLLFDKFGAIQEVGKKGRRKKVFFL
jgi:hypothetical protein